MKFHKLLFLALTIPCLTRADTYMVCRQGGCIAPLKSNEVSMESEVVRVNLAADESGYKVEATFTLKNESSTSITSLVAFPVLELPSFVLKQLDRDFIVEVGTALDAKPVFERVAFRADLPSVEPSNSAIGEMMLAPPREVPKYPKNIVWEMVWAPGETKLVRIRYTTETLPRIPNSTHCTQAAQLTYVVSTGNLWKGPIGKADFYFDFSAPNSTGGAGIEAAVVQNSDQEPDAAMRRITSYPTVAKWMTDSKVEWHFQNWTPTDEIFVRWVYWADVPQYEEDGHATYHYGLPATYIGDRERYSPEFLDRLVTKETILANEYFPERLTTVQLRRLRQWIAEWLAHEILARHGQEFNPIDHYETNGTNRYPVYKGTRWGMAFAGYSWHGGWYRPTGQVDEAKLSTIEKENLSFLRNESSRLKLQQQTAEPH